MYVEKDKSIQEIIGEGFDENEVRKIVSLIDFNEYKRRQAPLGIKISDRNFGKDQAIPNNQRVETLNIVLNII